MTAVLKASDWLSGQLSSVIQFDSCEALCMEYYVCTSHSLDLRPVACSTKHIELGGGGQSHWNTKSTVLICILAIINSEPYLIRRINLKVAK